MIIFILLWNFLSFHLANRFEAKVFGSCFMLYPFMPSYCKIGGLSSFNWRECVWQRHNYLLVINYENKQRVSENTAISELQEAKDASLVCIKGARLASVIPTLWTSGRLALPKYSKYWRHLSLTTCTKSRIVLVATNSSIFWILASSTLYANKN